MTAAECVASVAVISLALHRPVTGGAGPMNGNGHCVAPSSWSLFLRAERRQRLF
jgi:hypothetical protein